MAKSISIFGVAVILLLTAVDLFAAAPQLRSLGQLRSCGVATTGIAIDNAGNLFLAKAELNAVSKFDVYGRKLQHFAPLLIAGSGLAVSPLGDRIYVAGDKQVLVLSGDSGELLATLDGSGEFGRIAALVLDSRNNLYVTDADSGMMRVYDKQGGGLRGFPLFDVEQRQFVALAINSFSDEIWLAVADIESPGKVELQVYSCQGQYLRPVDLKNDLGLGYGAGFASLSFDSMGRLYIFDHQASTIVALDPRSSGISSTKIMGMEPLLETAPAGMVVDPVSSRLFVYSGQDVFIMQID